MIFERSSTLFSGGCGLWLVGEVLLGTDPSDVVGRPPRASNTAAATCTTMRLAVVRQGCRCRTARARSRWAIPAARSAVKVGRPIWSSTTVGDAALGQAGHGAHVEVAAVTHDPGGAHQVVLGDVGGLAGHRRPAPPVDRQGWAASPPDRAVVAAVEHVLAGCARAWRPRSGRRGRGGRRHRRWRPGRRPGWPILGGVDGRPGRGVEDDVDVGPSVVADRRGVGDVELRPVERDGLREFLLERAAELAVGPDDERGHWPWAAYFALDLPFSGPTTPRCRGTSRRWRPGRP